MKGLGVAASVILSVWSCIAVPQVSAGPFHVGTELGPGIVVREVLLHPEFIRLRVETPRGDEVTVEVSHHSPDVPPDWQTEFHRVMPGPGSSEVPEEVLKAILGQLREFEASGGDALVFQLNAERRSPVFVPSDAPHGEPGLQDQGATEPVGEQRDRGEKGYQSPYSRTFVRTVAYINRAIYLLAAVILVGLLALALRDHRREVGWVALALVPWIVLRFAVPWGPTTFVEAERYIPAISGIEPSDRHIGVGQYIWWSTRILGVPLAYRYAGLIVSVLALPGVFVLARLWSMPKTAAWIAMLVLGAWPAHIRFAGSAAFSPISSAAWLWALALLGTEHRIPWWSRVGGLLFVTIGVGARPESAAWILALWVLRPSSGWTWAATAAAVWGLVPPPSHGDLPYSFLAGLNQQWQVLELGAGPWWFALSLWGVVVYRRRRSVQALLVGIAPLVALYSALEFDIYQELVCARYQMTFVPMWTLFIGLGGAHVFRTWTARRKGVVLGLLICLWPGLGATRLFVPTDHQVEFEYLRETVPRMLVRYGTAGVWSFHVGRVTTAPLELVMFSLGHVPGTPLEIFDWGIVSPREGEVVPAFVGIDAADVSLERLIDGVEREALWESNINVQCDAKTPCVVRLRWYEVTRELSEAHRSSPERERP